jgi:hypothetical protein
MDAGHVSLFERNPAPVLQCSARKELAPQDEDRRANPLLGRWRPRPDQGCFQRDPEAADVTD